MHQIADTILQLNGTAALVLIFALPALEASAFVGFVFPGEIALLFGGVLAWQGKVPLWGVLAAGIAGAVIGDTVGYEIGKRWGDTVLRRLPHRLVKPHHVDGGKRLLRQLGGRAVFVGRFTAALRVLVPGLSGMSGIRYRTFLVWNVAGGMLWATGSVLLGYAAGSSYQLVERRLQLGSYAALAVVLTLVVLVLLVRWLRARRRAVADAVGGGADVADGGGADVADADAPDGGAGGKPGESDEPEAVGSSRGPR